MLHAKFYTLVSLSHFRLGNGCVWKMYAVVFLCQSGWSSPAAGLDEGHALVSCCYSSVVRVCRRRA